MKQYNPVELELRDVLHDARSRLHNTAVLENQLVFNLAGLYCSIRQLTVAEVLKEYYIGGGMDKTIYQVNPFLKLISKDNYNGAYMTVPLIYDTK